MEKPESRIHFLNKPHDAAGFGHAAILIPVPTGYIYYSFFANRRFVPFSTATLLAKEFPALEAALAYAKLEGYTREVHWPITPEAALAAHAALTPFATGTRWNLLTRNCWTAVSTALKAAGITAPKALYPNRIFQKCKACAEGWSSL